MPLISNMENKQEGSDVSLQNHDENIQTIEAVLQSALTGPSDELNQALEGEGFEDRQ
ncbi:MAG: hypothetical protein K0Q87_565 [Neobacillus sp.]|nr:hypothetical protein [Neobacillus sp.]